MDKFKILTERIQKLDVDIARLREADPLSGDQAGRLRELEAECWELRRARWVLLLDDEWAPGGDREEPRWGDVGEAAKAGGEEVRP